MFKLNSAARPSTPTSSAPKSSPKTKKGGIPGIKTDDKTGKIVIDLTKPRGTFTNELALLFVAPVPAGHAGQEPDRPTRRPATGPYEITKSEPGRGWSYARNPQWAKANAKLMPDLPSGHVDKIDIRVVRNDSTQVNEVERGKTDWMQTRPRRPLRESQEQSTKAPSSGSSRRSAPTTSG